MFAPCVWDPREAGKGRGFCQNLGPQPVDWSLKEEVPGPGDPEPVQERQPGGGCRLVAQRGSEDARGHPFGSCLHPKSGQ